MKNYLVRAIPLVVIVSIIVGGIVMYKHHVNSLDSFARRVAAEPTVRITDCTEYSGDIPISVTLTVLMNGESGTVTVYRGEGLSFANAKNVKQIWPQIRDKDVEGNFSYDQSKRSKLNFGAWVAK
jgi:hypothetical protein